MKSIAMLVFKSCLGKLVGKDGCVRERLDSFVCRDVCVWIYFGFFCGKPCKCQSKLVLKLEKRLDHAALCIVFLLLFEFSCRETVFGCVHCLFLCVCERTAVIQPFISSFA